MRHPARCPLSLFVLSLCLLLLGLARQASAAAVLPPSALVVPMTDADGAYLVKWTASPTVGATYVVQEATDSAFTTGVRPVPTTGLSATISGRPTGSTFYYRIMATKSGLTPSPWKKAVNGCAVKYPARPPASITVPTTDLDGTYVVSWGASPTSGVSYQLQEATNSAFTSGLRNLPVSGRSAQLSERAVGTYYYRVRALKPRLANSPWRAGGNGCGVTVGPPDVLVFNQDPASHIIADGSDGANFFTLKGDKGADNRIIKITEIALVSVDDRQEAHTVKLDAQGRPLSLRSPDGEVVLQYLANNQITVTATSSDSQTVETETITLPPAAQQALQTVMSQTAKMTPPVLMSAKEGTIQVLCDDSRVLPTVDYLKPNQPKGTPATSLDTRDLNSQTCAAGQCTTNYAYRLVVSEGLPPPEEWKRTCTDNLTKIEVEVSATSVALDLFWAAVLPGGLTRLVLDKIKNLILDQIVRRATADRVCSDTNYYKILDEINTVNISACKQFLPRLACIPAPLPVNPATQALPVIHLGPAPPVAKFWLKHGATSITEMTQTVPPGALLTMGAIDGYKDFAGNDIDGCATYQWRIVKQGSTAPAVTLYGRNQSHTFAQAGVYGITLTITNQKGLEVQQATSFWQLTVACGTVMYGGREWQQCGSLWPMWWDYANAYCAALNVDGQTGWVLPSIDQLRSLIVCSNGTQVTFGPDNPTGTNSCDQHGTAAPYASPTISSVFTSFTFSASAYWSSTTYSPSPGFAWAVGFWNGAAFAPSKSGVNYVHVRCVR